MQNGLKQKEGKVGEIKEDITVLPRGNEGIDWVYRSKKEEK